MGDFSDTRIRIIGKFFKGSGKGTEINRLLTMDWYSRINFLNNKQSILLSYHDEFYRGFINKAKDKIYISPKVKIYAGSKEIIATIEKTKDYTFSAVEKIVDTAANEMVEFKKPIKLKVTFEIKPKDLMSFLDGGMIYYNFSVIRKNPHSRKVALKIKDKFGLISEELSTFYLAVENIKPSLKLRGAYPGAFEKLKVKFPYMKIDTALDAYDQFTVPKVLIRRGGKPVQRNSSLLNSFFSINIRKINSLDKKSSQEYPSYFLVKFGYINDKTLKINDVKDTHSYDGVIAVKKKINSNRESVTLVSPQKIEWITYQNQKYIPVSYKNQSDDPVDSEKKKKRPNYTILRPIDPKLTVLIYQFNQQNKKWVLTNLYPPLDTEVRELCYSRKWDQWSIRRINLWGSIEKPFSIVKGINKNFIVECTHAERHSIVQARNIEKFVKRANKLDYSIALIDLFPEKKKERKAWQYSETILFQQSTVGEISEKTAQLIEINNKTKEIVKCFSAKERGQVTFLDGSKFRNGSYIISFGPKTARFDIAPGHKSIADPTMFYSQSEETHTILATGYHPKNSLGDYGLDPFPSLFNY